MNCTVIRLVGHAGHWDSQTIVMHWSPGALRSLVPFTMSLQVPFSSPAAMVCTYYLALGLVISSSFSALHSMLTKRAPTSLAAKSTRHRHIRLFHHDCRHGWRLHSVRHLQILGSPLWASSEGVSLVVVADPLVVPDELLRHRVSVKAQLKVLFLKKLLNLKQQHNSLLVSTLSQLARAYKETPRYITARV